MQLPKTTQINKHITKEQLTKTLNLTPELKKSLTNDIQKITLTNQLSPKSINISEGQTTKSIFIIQIQLKQQTINYKLIQTLAQQNKSKTIFMLTYQQQTKFAIYYDKTYYTDWQNQDQLTLTFEGNNLDQIWENLIRQIALEDDSQQPQQNLKQQLAHQQQRQQLEKKLASLQKQAFNEQQPYRKIKLVSKIAQLKKSLEGLE